MTHRSRLIVMVAACVVFAVSPARAEDPPPPNVVLIISDDQAWTDYGFMGHEHIRTPHLDRLASQSRLFTRGYVTDSLCRPSLATIVTGLYPHQHGIVGNDPTGRQGSPESHARRERMISRIDRLATLPKLLAERGYVSHQSGKWWEGNWRRGGFTAGMTRGFPEKGGRHGDDGLTIGREGLGPVTDFIDRAVEDGKPFFVWYAPFMPHTPHNPPQRLLEKYRDKTDSLHIARYWAMCEWFDETCGELLAHLDQRGVAENTLVVYVTDNGWIQEPNAPRYAERSKRSRYDGGLRTPIMLRWPSRITPKRDEQTLASSIDLAPTILRAAGIAAADLPPDLHGVNLLDAGALAKRDRIFGAIYEHDVVDVERPAASLLQRWVIQRRWKLIVPHAPRVEGEVELYDLIADPHERDNRAASEAQRVQRMTEQLDAWWSPGGSE